MGWILCFRKRDSIHDESERKKTSPHRGLSLCTVMLVYLHKADKKAAVGTQVDDRFLGKMWAKEMIFQSSAAS